MFQILIRSSADASATRVLKLWAATIFIVLSSRYKRLRRLFHLIHELHTCTKASTRFLCFPGLELLTRYLVVAELLEPVKCTLEAIAPNLRWVGLQLLSRDQLLRYTPKLLRKFEILRLGLPVMAKPNIEGRVSQVSDTRTRERKEKKTNLLNASPNTLEGKNGQRIS